MRRPGPAGSASPVAAMNRRPRGSLWPPPPSPPPLLLLAPLVFPLLAVSSLAATSATSPAASSGVGAPLPAALLERLQSGRPRLPPAAFSFDGIATGTQRYPETVRYRTLTAKSACHCRLLCLADVRCMGYEHEAASGSCGLTDVLLPANVTEETAGGWSAGRRRGVSWLQQPCRADRDCSLLVAGAVCGSNGSCACRAGWSPLSDELCRPDRRYVQVTSGTLAASVPIGVTAEASLTACQDACRRTPGCWALDYAESTSRCRQYAAGVQAAAAAEPDNQTSVGYVWQFPRPDGAAPAAAVKVADRLFLLSEPVVFSGAVDACWQLGAVQYSPDEPELMQQIYEGIIGSTVEGKGRVGVGGTDLLKEGRFEIPDGTVLTADDPHWRANEPNNAGPGEDCIQISGSRDLNDVPCTSCSPQLCEYVGENLLVRPVGAARSDNLRQLTWWTADLGAVLQVTRVLYVAEASGNVKPRVTEIRVGRHRTNSSDLESTLCGRQTGPPAAAKFSRLFSCPQPLAGRYLHVGQRPGQLPGWQRLAVFGNRY